MSKHNAEFIMREMPFARGLQFRTLYWHNKGIEIEESKDEESGLESVIE